MKLTYIYHSGFVLEFDDFAIIIDYYKSMDKRTDEYLEQLLASGKLLYVLVSHSHHDHFNPDILRWETPMEDIIYIFSKDLLDEGKSKVGDAFYLQKTETYEDRFLKIKAYGSTDLGISFYIEVEGKRYFHAGDLNNWHWNEESTAKEVEEAEDFYHNELAEISKEVKHLDLAIFPIDARLGKDFMKGAREFIEAIQTDVLAPMHFTASPDKIKLFEPIAHKHHCQYICWKSTGESIII
ncbi:MBL fold metallo-hydrolase [Dysgonomonas sp. 25]|uniref:MBL fold metallo-hydrolase n=1 Tax=Dysgonomonas sp. 25 TaxID=2302933 RepID=UPI0013D29CFC|nr:MBL fold metallo-hydrolase [Dysgonomonas sp. 25]NDV69622.1 MBL fold metallo-hydrolase [Dysgonomonas sp. 25]